MTRRGLLPSVVLHTQWDETPFLRLILNYNGVSRIELFARRKGTNCMEDFSNIFKGKRSCQTPLRSIGMAVGVRARC